MIEITNYKPINKGHVVASFNVNISEWNFFINNITLFMKNGRRWLSMPNKEYEKDGQKNYFPLCGFDNREAQDRFQASCMTALDKYFMSKQIEIQQPIVNEVPF